MSPVQTVNGATEPGTLSPACLPGSTRARGHLPGVYLRVHNCRGTFLSVILWPFVGPAIVRNVLLVPAKRR